MDGHMCDGHRCPLRFTCLRLTGKPRYFQYYFVEPPYVMHDNKAMCDKYWPDEEKLKENEDKTVLDR